MSETIAKAVRTLCQETISEDYIRRIASSEQASIWTVFLLIAVAGLCFAGAIYFTLRMVEGGFAAQGRLLSTYADRVANLEDKLARMAMRVGKGRVTYTASNAESKEEQKDQL